MPSKKPRGCYSGQLVNEIREYHARFLERGKRRRSKNTPLELAPITNEMLADCLSMDKSWWHNIINGKAYLDKDTLFRIISMPWVAPDAAQRWMFLWMANELDTFEIGQSDEVIAFREGMKTKTWTPKRNLERLAASLALLSDYVPTLGVINQIDHARKRENKTIRDPEWRLPSEGPAITCHDLEVEPAPEGQKYTRMIYKKQRLYRLTKRYAEIVAAQELKEHTEHLVGLLNDEQDEADVIRASAVSAMPQQTTDEDNEPFDEELRQSVIAELGLGVENYLYAVAAADMIIAFAKSLPDNA